MIETLKTLCIKQTAKHIVEGRLKTSPHKLDKQTSDLVFAEFVELSEHPQFSESCQYIKNLLTVTKMWFSTESFDENFCKMVYDQDIRDLGLYNLSGWKMFHINGNESKSGSDDKEEKKENVTEEDENGSGDSDEEEEGNDAAGDRNGSQEEEDNESDGDDYNGDSDVEEEDESKKLVDIIAVLEKMLNPEARKKLLSLEFTGIGLELLPGWVEQLSTLLPSLEILKMVCLEAEENAIQSIYQYFPNLKELEISKSKITNLTGISKLSKLTWLNIGEIEFDGKEGLDELFELKNLRMLVVEGDMESDQKSNTMMLYLESGKSLPQLENLECSYCEMTEEMLQKLLESHKNLKMIDLMGTQLENHPQITGRGLKLLTMGTVKDCLYTLDTCIKNDAVSYYMQPIFAKLMEVLDSEYDQISQKELSDCLELMCKTIETYCDLRDWAAEVLYRMFRDDRAKKFSFAERQLLIFSIIHAFQIEKEVFSQDTGFIINESVWGILANEAILNNSETNIDTICENAVYAFQESIVNVSPVFDTMLVLAGSLDKMSTDRGRALARDLKFTEEVIEALIGCSLIVLVRDPNEREFTVPLYCTRILNQLYKMRDERSERTLEVDKKCVRVLCRTVAILGEHQDIMNCLVVTLGDVIIRMSEGALQFLFEEKERLLDFVKIFFDKNTDQQAAAVRLVYLMLLHNNPNKTELLENKSMRDVNRSLLEDVRTCLNGFENSEVLDGLKWVLEKSEKRITKEMCKWIIEEMNAGGEDESEF